MNTKTLKDYSEEIYKCSKCGLCQAACPVYKKTGMETTLSRGGFTLLNGIIAGHLKFNKKIAKKLDFCMGCKSCYDFCPSGISAEEIFSVARHECSKATGRVMDMNFIKNFIIQNFSSNFSLRILKALLTVYKMFLPLLNIFLKIFPFNSFKYLDYLKIFNAQLTEHVKQKKLLPANPLQPLKIFYFPGCINNYINPSIKNAVMMVMEKNGFNVEIPEDFSCCGIAAKNCGDFKTFKELAEKNTRLIHDDIDFLITDCASCGSVWEFYPEFTDSELRRKALQISQKSININKFLVEQGIYIPKNMSKNTKNPSKPLKVTYHDPCHLKKFQRVYKEPRVLLEMIPGVEFVEMDDADACCGAAGTYCLSNPKVSRKISLDKFENIIKSSADIVCTSCAGCKIGIFQGVIAQGALAGSKYKEISVYSPVELLALSYTKSQSNK